MMLRSWFLPMLLLGGGWAAACPEGCSCHHEQGLYVANCSSLPYTGGKFEALTIFSTRDSPMELSDGQFNSARRLKYLNLRNSSIYFVHKKAFYGAKNLVEINLSFNFIEELDSTVFQHLTNLTTLILRGNPIQFMSEVPFLFSNSLQHLDIGECQIRSIPREIFYGLKQLKYLSMDGNFIKSLKHNSLPKGLKYLNLSHNLIVNVPSEVLPALTSLRRIGLSGNPINCSCSLMNLQDWFSGRGVILEGNVTCALPSEYYGMSWSKVDENRLCFAEARREAISHSINYTPLLKKRVHRKNYFESENSYSMEHLQSDQPQPLLPDSQAEVLFQNDDTLAMGEMMRDEEDKSLNKEEQSNLNKDSADEIKGKSDAIEGVPADKKHTEVKTEELQDVSTLMDHQILEAGETENKNKQTILSVDGSAVHMSQSGSLATENLNLQGVVNSPRESIEKSKADGGDEYLDSLKQNAEGSVEILSSTNNSTNSTVEKITDLAEGQDHLQNLVSEGSAIDPDSSQHVNLNESNPVVYKALNEEDSTAELDDFKKEGLFHVENDKYKLNTNDSTEESTAIPEIEYTTEDEVAPTQEILTVDVEESDLDEEVDKNVTSSTEINNSTIVENNVTSEEDEVKETVPPPVIVPDLLETSEPQQNVSEKIVPINESEASINPDIIEENKSVLGPAMTSDNKEKIKEVAGAEVVMFCIAVLIICLVLYSIYKCRTSNKRQSIRIVKDMESNRGTEMQDMASLLPTPQDDGKKNNFKYTDKAPTSETMKLITEKNETDTSKFTPVADSKNKIDNKNSLNNNTSSSPTNKTPLIKPGNPVTINPAAPIQKTKVKVGIIPDSIPRTPIFLQKTYNGRKNV